MAPNINDIISNHDLSKRIFFNLTKNDVRNVALVNKIWYKAARVTRSQATIKISVEFLDELLKKEIDLKQYIKQNHQFANEIEIMCRSGKAVSNAVYDSLFDSELTAKKLTLKGFGNWDTCYCPKKGSTCGEQYDTIKREDLTNLVYIYISTTFSVSSCALLDLVSRSPKLRVLGFYGKTCKDDHTDLFNSKRFYSDLDRVYWPWPNRTSLTTMTTLLKRNENVTTFCSNAETVCDFLASDALPNLRFLSITLNENWSCKPGKTKKVRRFRENLKYLSSAKKIEALEVRTFDIFNESGCEKTDTEVERVYEHYKLDFWEQVGKLHNLKYLAVYGAWEFEQVCRELAKHALQVEFLKVNLMPSSVLTAVDNGDDEPILTMIDGVKDLRKLPQLRSLHYSCCEKLGSIDSKTTTALKELIDLFWIIDIKTIFTNEVEEFVNCILRRGNQLGKTYKVLLHVQPKDNKYADIMLEATPRFSMAKDLRSKLTSMANSVMIDRFGKPACETFHLWGIEQVGNSRDESMFKRLKSGWHFYNELFNPTAMLI